MRNERVTIKISYDNKGNEMLDFYLDCAQGSGLYLFSRRFSKGVYEFFMYGVSLPEILSFNKWYLKNKKLNKTIERLPSFIKYAKQELARDLAEQEQTETRARRHEKSRDDDAYEDLVA